MGGEPNSSLDAVRDEPLQQPSDLGGRPLDRVAEYVVVVVLFAQAVGQLGDDEARLARAVVLVHSLWSRRDTLAYLTLISALSQKPHYEYKSGFRKRDGVSGRVDEVSGHGIGTKLFWPVNERF
jgi:hypothetical protein